MTSKTRIPLLNKFRKPIDSDEPKVRKVSIFKLWRYTTRIDQLMLLVGICVSICTGFSMPYLAIIIGSMSNAIVNATLATDFYFLPVNTSDGWRFIGDIYVLEDFRASAMHRVYQSIVIGFIIFCSATTQVYCFLFVCENMMTKLRKAFFKAVMRQNIGWYDENQTGALASKMFDNLERIQEGAGDKIALAIQYTAQFFGGFIVAFTYDWKLTLIMTSLSPLLIICGAFIAQLMAKSSLVEAQKYAKAGAIAEESIASIRTVYSLNGQKKEVERYDAALKKAEWMGIQRSIYIGVGLALTVFILFGSYCLAFWVGVDFVVDDGMESEVMIAVFFSVMMGSMALGQASPQYAVVGTAQGCAASIFEVIDRAPEIDSCSAVGTTPKIEGRIVFKDVNFVYPTRPDIMVLNGLSLDIKPGQIVALVGSSGCGKSTICSLLLRYYNSAAGQIVIDGHPIESINIKHLRRNIGVVSQEPVLFNCSIRENVQYGHNEEVSEEKMQDACRKANCLDFIRRLPRGFDTIVGEKGMQLSGGQKQRVAIARALIASPALLILDEATSALDAESESLVQNALNRVSKDVTTLVIAHRLSTVKSVDRIFAISEGKVKEAGTHNELMAARGLYYNLVNSQVFADTVEEEIEEFSHQQDYARSSVDSAASLNFNSHLPMSRGSVVIEADLNVGKKNDTFSEKKRLMQELKDEGARPKNLIQILKYAQPEVPMIFGGIFCCIVSGCVFPVFSVFFSNILEVFAEPDSEDKRRRGHEWALMFLVLGAIQAVCMLLHSIFFGTSAERLTKRLRSKLFSKIFSMEIGFFDAPNHSTGKLCTRLSSDCPNVKAAIDYRLGAVFSSVVSMVFGVVLAFYYNWIMAILLTSIFPLAGIGYYIQIRFFRHRSYADVKGLESAGNVAIEAMQNIRTVQAFTLESRFYDRFCEYLMLPLRIHKHRAVLQALSYGFACSIFYFIHAASFAFGVWLIMNELSKPMSVIRTLFAISFTTTSLAYASVYFPEYAKARFAAGLIFKMLSYKPQIDNMNDERRNSVCCFEFFLANAIVQDQVKGQLSFKNINFHYPQRKQTQVLRNFNLHVEAGKSLALVGASGSGKSTIIALLERFYDPTSGVIEIDGKDIRELSVQQIRSQMTLVSQEPILFDRSIRENIVYGLRPDEYTEDDIVEVLRLANIETTIAELPDKLETRVGDRGVQLSGGQKQRVSIARALIRKPKILLLDESTSALDAESEKLVQKALDFACSGRTSIIVAHRLSTIVNCDKIAVMKNGNIVEIGTHQALIDKKGVYFELTEKQNMKQ